MPVEQIPSRRHLGAFAPAGLVLAGGFFFDALSLHASQFCPREPLNTTHIFCEVS